PLDALGEDGEGDEAGDGDDQAHDGGVQGFGNTGGHAGDIRGGAAGAQGGKDLAQAGDGAEQAKERPEADDDFQQGEAAFQVVDCFPRQGLEGGEVLGLGPGKLAAGLENDAGEGGIVLLDEVQEVIEVELRGGKVPDRVLDSLGDHQFPLQGDD